MRKHPYEILLDRKRKWSPVKPTVGALKDGSEDTIRRALAARHLELPVGAFITEGLEKTVPENARKLLEDNVKDEERHDLALGYYTDALGTNEIEEKEGKWFNKIQGLESSLVNLDTSEFTVQGVGMVADVIYTGTIYTGGPEDCYDINGEIIDCNSDDCVEGPCGEVFIEVLGCIDPNASNYDSGANTDNGTCEYFVVGCMDAVAPYFNP